MSSSHPANANQLIIFRSLFHFYSSLFFTTWLFSVKHSQLHTHDDPPPALLFCLPSLPPALTLFLTFFFSMWVLSHSLAPLCFHPLALTLSPFMSLCTAGGEHFLMGENLTVAVLGVVIPIGKLSLSVFVCPH